MKNVHRGYSFPSIVRTYSTSRGPAYTKTSHPQITGAQIEQPKEMVFRSKTNHRNLCPTAPKIKDQRSKIRPSSSSSSSVGLSYRVARLPSRTLPTSAPRPSCGEGWPEASDREQRSKIEKKKDQIINQSFIYIFSILLFLISVSS